MEVTSCPAGMSPDLSGGQSTSSSRGKRESSCPESKCLLLSVSSAKLSTEIKVITLSHLGTTLFKLLKKYTPEDDKQKAERLKQAAENKQQGTAQDSKKPTVLKFGLQHVTKLVEEKKAKLVVIATDVDPIELVIWLPTLCRKMDVPYTFVKSKAALGTLVNQKTATCVALVDFKKDVISYLNSGCL